MAALVDLSTERPTLSKFPSPMHTISPLSALDRTVVNISKNYRGQMESIACAEFQTPTFRRDGFLSPPTKPKHSPAVASLLSRPDNRLTPLSNFPSRELPLPGVSPQCLDKAEDEYFRVNTAVLVRRFNTKSGEWSEWRRGVVWEVNKATYVLGTYAREYRVHCLETPSITESYAAFMGEICNPTKPLEPEITSKEYSFRMLRKSQVYARLPTKDEEKAPPVWVPSIATGFENGKISEVHPLATEHSGSGLVTHAVRPHEVLPYSPETAKFCLDNGHYVVADDGRIFGPPFDSNDVEMRSSEGSTSS